MGIMGRRKATNPASEKPSLYFFGWGVVGMRLGRLSMLGVCHGREPFRSGRVTERACGEGRRSSSVVWPCSFKRTTSEGRGMRKLPVEPLGHALTWVFVREPATAGSASGA